MKKIYKVLLLVICILFTSLNFGEVNTFAKGSSRGISSSRSSSSSSSRSSSSSSSRSGTSSSSSSSRSGTSSSSSSSKSGTSSSSSSSRSGTSSSSSSSRSGTSSSSSSSQSGTSSSSSSSRSGTSSSSSSSKSGTSSSSSSSQSGTSSSSSSSQSGTSSSSYRSNSYIDLSQEYKPKEKSKIEDIKVKGKNISSKEISDVLENKGINPTTTKKYYYPQEAKRSIFDNPFVQYYLVHNIIDDTVDMVQDITGYDEDRLVGVVSNENGQDEIIMFEDSNKSNFNIFKFIIWILIFLIIFIFIIYFITFRKRR